MLLYAMLQIQVSMSEQHVTCNAVERMLMFDLWAVRIYHSRARMKMVMRARLTHHNFKLLTGSENEC